MKARELAMKLMRNPEHEVVVLEGGKFEDNIPSQKILMVDTDSYEDNEGENHDVIQIIVESNPETELIK